MDNKLVRNALRAWLDIWAAVVTVGSLTLDLANFGSIQWQVIALLAFLVFVGLVYTRVYRQHTELDRRGKYQTIANDLSDYMAESDKMLATFVANVSPATMDEVTKWASRTASYLDKNCGKSYREQFIIIDWAKPAAMWEAD